jgi:cobyrinic acid a,c-diamide synthase
VVGYFPQKDGVHIGSRHLGLMTASEISNLNEVIDLLGETAAECIDLDLLLSIGREAEALPLVEKPSIPEHKKAKIAVAWDKAFCFYYKENLEILEQFGAELAFFSPVLDTELPEGTGGIYLGGGYPESYARELSHNVSMRAAIRDAVSRGVPIIAECGGYMYTCKNLIDTEGNSSSMLGLIPTDVMMTKRLSMQFGYVDVIANRDTAFFDKGTVIRAHEFHYSKAKQDGDACTMRKSTGRSWMGLYADGHVLAGYPHFYFHNCKEMARRFVDLAAR